MSATCARDSFSAESLRGLPVRLSGRCASYSCDTAPRLLCTARVDPLYAVVALGLLLRCRARGGVCKAGGKEGGAFVREH